MKCKKKIKRILVRIHEAGGCGASTEYSKGWDAAISESLTIIEEETGISINDLI